MQLKPGASLVGVKWEMFIASILLEAVWEAEGYRLIITSGTDGKHAPDSLHPYGYALDYRNRGMTLDVRARIKVRAEFVLGKNYQVIEEATHFHVEYDPTRKGIAGLPADASRV